MASFRGNKFFLSNFFKASVYYDGVLYNTVEHAFQAAKTLNLEDRERILLCIKPSDAKRLGHKVNLRPDWKNVRVNIMKELVFQKFLYPELAKALIAIEGQIIEGNEWHDNFWGACSCKKCENKIKENNLGKILMAVRNHLKKTYSSLGEK